MRDEICPQDTCRLRELLYWQQHAERAEARLAEVVEALRDVIWLDEFVVEPEWFPNEGDRQYWQERRRGLLAQAELVLGKDEHKET